MRSIRDSRTLPLKKAEGPNGSHEGRRPSIFRKAGKIAAPVLVSGLVLLGCDSRESSEMAPKQSLDLNNAPVSFSIKNDQVCKGIFVNFAEGEVLSGKLAEKLSKSEVSNILSPSREDRTFEIEVRKGDVILRRDTDYYSDNAHLSYGVVDIDDAGVLLRFEQITPCEVSSTYFRVNFDGSDTTSENWKGAFKVKKSPHHLDVVKLTVKLEGKS